MSASKKGKSYHSPEWKAELSRRMIGNKFMVGRKLSEEHKKKISNEGKILRKWSAEEEASIVEAYLAGARQNDLCLVHKTEHRSIRKILIKHGVVISRNGQGKRYQMPRLF